MGTNLGYVNLREVEDRLGPGATAVVIVEDTWSLIRTLRSAGVDWWSTLRAAWDLLYEEGTSQCGTVVVGTPATTISVSSHADVLVLGPSLFMSRSQWELARSCHVPVVLRSTSAGMDVLYQGEEMELA